MNILSQIHHHLPSITRRLWKRNKLHSNLMTEMQLTTWNKRLKLLLLTQVFGGRGTRGGPSGSRLESESLQKKQPAKRAVPFGISG